MLDIVVAGIDPGSRAFGYCALRTNGTRYDTLALESLTLRGDKIRRLRCLGEELRARLERDEPVAIAVEAGSIPRNPKFAQGALVVSEARGIALYAAAARRARQVFEVPVQSARAALGVARFGQGREEGKRRVLYVVTALLRPPYAPTEDAADAAALAIWAAHQLAVLYPAAGRSP